MRTAFFCAGAGWADVPLWVQYPGERLAYVVLVVATLGWLAVARQLRGRIPDRFIDPFARNRTAFLLTGVWAVFAFFSFVWLVPAASYFYSRLTLVLLAPSILFGAMLFAAVARVVLPRHSSALAPALFVLALLPFGRATLWVPAGNTEPHPLYGVIDHLEG